MASHNVTVVINKLQLNRVPSLLSLVKVDLGLVALMHLTALLTGPAPLQAVVLLPLPVLDLELQSEVTANLGVIARRQNLNFGLLALLLLLALLFGLALLLTRLLFLARLGDDAINLPLLSLVKTTALTTERLAESNRLVELAATTAEILTVA